MMVKERTTVVKEYVLSEDEMREIREVLHFSRDELKAWLAQYHDPHSQKCVSDISKVLEKIS